MPTFNSFAVIGVGLVGTPIVEALLAKGVSVVVLTRSSSNKNNKSLPSGAKTAIVDYDDPASVTKALKEHNVEVIVSTIAGPAVDVQLEIADAAKAAGVKLFAPSEFGIPTLGATDGFRAGKEKIALHLKSLGIPSARFFTGLFMTGVSWLLEYEDGKVRIIGKGNSPTSFTAVDDIAGFVAHTLTTLPRSELENSVFRLEGDRATLLEAANLVGKDVKVERVESFSGPMGAFRNLLHKEIEEGHGSTGWDLVTEKEGTGSGAAGSSNGLWSGHKWTTLKDHFANQSKK